MKKMIRWIKDHKLIALLVIGLICGGVYFGFNNDKGNSSEKPMIETSSVSVGDIEISVSGTGQVFAGSQVDLKPQVAGDGLDIREISVKNDQEVKKGDLIAVLDTTDVDQKIREAELKTQSSEISLKQSEEQYDEQTKDDKYQRQSKEVSLAQSQLSLNNAYTDLEDYYIRAPFDGTVTGLEAEVGDSISRTEILASVITDDVKAVISLNEVDAAKVKIGNNVNLTFDALDDVNAVGTVSKVDTIGVVDQGVVTYDVEIVFDSPSDLLKPGMSTSANIVMESVTDVVTIPQSAIKENKESETYVLLSDGSDDMNGITKKTIETGITNDVMIEVKSGLSAGDLVVVKINKQENTDTKKEAGSIIPMGGKSGGGRMR